MRRKAFEAGCLKLMQEASDRFWAQKNASFFPEKQNLYRSCYLFQKKNFLIKKLFL